MLHTEQNGNTGPLVVMLHWLGGSSRSWLAVSQGLAVEGFCCAAIDLPGFGAEAQQTDFSVAESARQVVATIAALRSDHREQPWVLAGHSMGGKFAMIVGRMAEDRAEGLEHLAGVILVSPSPPGPEPMSQAKRVDLAKSLGPAERDPNSRRKNSAKFLDDNTGLLPLMSEMKAQATEDVLRVNANAVLAWLDEGSREDWSSKVGRLPMPVLILAGSEDKALGEAAQREHTLPRFDRATITVLQGGGHLAPLERPAEVVDRIAEFCRDVGVAGSPAEVELGTAIRQLIESGQTSPQTREAMVKRLTRPEVSEVFSAEEARTLRALVARVVPGAGFDLAKRVQVALAGAARDGWRYDRLPEDRQAWKQGLLSLDLSATREFKVPFVALDADRQDELLNHALEGKLGKGWLGAMHLGESETAFDADQMRDWFEEVRGELAKLYVSDPRTMEPIGFAGFADEQGFTQIRLEDHGEAL